MKFSDRRAAGLLLAERMMHLKQERPVVLGLPRGGVAVAVEIARALDAPLDVLLVRKLGVPFHRELAFGAIGENDTKVLNDDLVRRLRLSDEEIALVEGEERAELARRVALYRGDRPVLTLVDKTVVIVDDGLATGATARVAIQVARARGAKRIVIAVPVAPPDVAGELSELVDEVIVVETPTRFQAVGQWYVEFDQTTDHEVTSILSNAWS